MNPLTLPLPHPQINKRKPHQRRQRQQAEIQRRPVPFFSKKDPGEHLAGEKEQRQGNNGREHQPGGCFFRGAGGVEDHRGHHHRQGGGYQAKE